MSKRKSSTFRLSILLAILTFCLGYMMGQSGSYLKVDIVVPQSKTPPSMFTVPPQIPWSPLKYHDV